MIMLSNTNLCSFKEYQLTGVHQDTCTSAWRISSYRRTSDKSLSTSLQVLPLWPLKVVQWAAITTRIFKYRSRRWLTSLHYAGKSDMVRVHSSDPRNGNKEILNPNIEDEKLSILTKGSQWGYIKKQHMTKTREIYKCTFVGTATIARYGNDRWWQYWWWT